VFVEIHANQVFDEMLLIQVIVVMHVTNPYVGIDSNPSVGMDLHDEGFDLTDSFQIMVK